MNIYIHVPFCRRKCGYCAFYSLDEFAPDLVEAWLAKLERDVAATMFPEAIDTVYFGGGTPTLLAPEQLTRLERLTASLPLEPDAEITMEANPETLNPEKIAVMRRFVNRLSCGVQSFDPAIRQLLGRDCSDAAIAALSDLPFIHRSCDLIYAVPGQTIDGFRRDLELAVQSGVDHISCYSLTIEEGSLLAGTDLSPDDDQSADMWHLAGELLASHGFARYEISNYARPGAECRHNCNVWHGDLLYGFGPAAAAYDGRKRYRQADDLRAWLAGAPPEIDDLPPAARRREIFAVNLRTVSGWTKSAYLALPGATAAEWQTLLELARSLPHLHAEQSEIRLTQDGLLFWDELAAEFL